MKSAEVYQYLLSNAHLATMDLCRFHIRKECFQSREETLSCHMITFACKGKIKILANGKLFILSSNQSLYLPKGTKRMHFKDTEEETRYYNLRFHYSENTDKSFPPLLKTLAPNTIRYFMQWNDIYLHRPQNAHYHFLGLWVQFLCYVLSEKNDDLESTNRLDFYKRNQIQQFIHENISNEISIANLAKNSRLSLDYFSRVFKRTYGMAPKKYIIIKKMQRATELLKETKLDINQIAQQIGFNNFSLFCKQFKQIHGVTPSEYRKDENISLDIHAF